MMNESPSKWEWSADEIKTVGYRVVDIIAEHLTTLPDRPVFQAVPDQIVETFMTGPVPLQGRTPDAILDEFTASIERYPFGNGHPRFFGWVNSPPAVMGIFAEALAAALNPSCAGGNHAAVYVEKQVINWFKQLLGFPQDAYGLLVSGGSMAALTALAVARQAKAGVDIRQRGLQDISSRLTFYKSREGHSCHQKALELLGIGAAQLRVVAHDAAFRMEPSALQRAIEQDRQSGCTPVAVIASAGAVNTGAIDPLDDIADVCRDQDVWLHVDGAYGAPAILSERYADQLAGLSRADSIALDPHKWLCVPVEAGVVLIRDAALQRSTFSLVPPYLRTDANVQGVGGPPWFSEYGFQQTRGFRALKVWMAFLHHGVDGYREAINRTIDLATELASLLRLQQHVELCDPQSLSIVCFRIVPPELADDADGLTAFNKAVLEEVQLGGRAFLSSTVIDGVFWLRACVLNPRTTPADVAMLVETVVTAASARMSLR
jgi:aromatic-L-amino-acid/L-tryptophan decarboxylase